ncbi:hypothetical protein [Sphingomonas sp.]|jgi:hypothetical protein|uniref:hypothetical protein n=1 Tax=Sphingomonas sp. TaxID=28214 RepID=UPI002D80E22B|nr:hypothetical protein [Sphingomonas sp.]HEU0044338.1 hypothetical protein [Sphingomonas sp.]
MAKLKVFRTPIGFHDAYVAAPSRHAALKAWGADADLFARGVAELVTDPALTAEPLARPGEVVKRSRGSVAEQLAAAAPPERPEKAPARQAKAKPALPRPERDAVEAAETALAHAEASHKAAEQALAREEAALAERRRALRDRWASEREALENTRDVAAQRYEAAMRAWRKVGG